MPDTQFLSAFAEHPLTLTILMIGAITGLFIWKVAPSLRVLKPLNDKVDTIIEHDKRQDAAINNMGKDTLRLNVYNENFEIEDRLVSFKRYKEIGGNGATERYAQKLIDENSEIWRLVCKLDGGHDGSK
jgi:hypothetical protein